MLITLKHKHYANLSLDQIKFIFSTPNEDELNWRTQIWLYLLNLEFVPQDEIAILAANDPDVGSAIDALYNLTTNECVYLRHKGTDEVLRANTQDLSYAIIEETKWLAEDHSFLSLPIKDIRIGKHKYRLPSVLMFNTTWQQYTNAQQYVTMSAKAIKRLLPPDTPKNRTIDSSNPRSVDSSTNPPLDPSTLHRISQTIVKAQTGFLASLLVPYRWEFSFRYPFFRKVPKYNPSEEASIMEEMKQAPQWLYDMLTKWYDDTQTRFAKSFPKCFTGGGTTDKPKQEDWVSQLGTTNLIKEKGNYTSSDAVLQEQATVVLKLIDDVMRESEEMKKEMDRINRKK